MSEWVYLLQWRKDIGTNIYKIGRSSSEELERLKNYGNGSTCFGMARCTNSESVERTIINFFKGKYQLATGREWFMGDIIEMERDFFTLVLANAIFDRYSESQTINMKHFGSSHDKDDMSRIFPQYNDDTEFGGMKAFCRLQYKKSPQDEYGTYWIAYISDQKLKIYEETITSRQLQIMYDKIFGIGTNFCDKTFDLNEETTRTFLLGCKQKVQIHDYELDKENQSINKIFSSPRSHQITLYFTVDSIINDSHYGLLYGDPGDIFEMNPVTVDNSQQNILLYKIGETYVSVENIKEHLPCSIKISNGKYRIVFSNSIHLIRCKNAEVNEHTEYLYDGNFNSGTQFIKDYMAKWNELTIDMECLNMTDDTNKILEILQESIDK